MKKGFTLAEVLITLAIIGVVAALTIPSVILNTNQTEYKTALKKAVSVLNQAVSLELALENLSPSEATSAANLLSMLQSQMNTISAADTSADCDSFTAADGTGLSQITNADKCMFTTTDGIQFAYATAYTDQNFGSVDGVDASTGAATEVEFTTNSYACTDANPCALLIDVNGDKNPNQLTTDPATPKDRFFLWLKGANGTTVVPNNVAAEIMFAK